MTTGDSMREQELINETLMEIRNRWAPGRAMPISPEVIGQAAKDITFLAEMVNVINAAHEKELAEAKTAILLSISTEKQLEAELKEAREQIEKLDKLAYLEGEPGHETTWKQEAESLLAVCEERDKLLTASQVQIGQLENDLQVAYAKIAAMEKVKK